MTDSTTDKPSGPEQYLLKEFEKLRGEIEATLNNVWSNERYGVVAFGAVWSWLASRHVSSVAAWSLPIVIAIAGFSRNWSLYRHLFLMGDYMRTVEISLVGEKGAWEIYFEKRRKEKQWFRFVGDHVIWIVLCVADVVLLILIKAGCLTI
jgi:hypothetical protein